jgi:hypothetical protein
VSAPTGKTGADGLSDEISVPSERTGARAEVEGLGVADGLADAPGGAASVMSEPTPATP